MTLALHGQTCAILLFEEPGGEIESLSLVQGVLQVSGDAVLLFPHGGGDAVPIPPHLVEMIEIMSDDHRECLADIVSTYWVRAFYDGRLNHASIDLAAVLAQCSLPPAVD